MYPFPYPIHIHVLRLHPFQILSHLFVYMLVSQRCNQCKCMTWLNVTGHYSLHGNECNLQMQIAIYNDLLWKFVSNSYYFKKIYFLRVTSLHPKFYMPIFLWDVESSPNYTEKLIFAGIGTITLCSEWIQISTVIPEQQHSCNPWMHSKNHSWAPWKAETANQHTVALCSFSSSSITLPLWNTEPTQ
jgi:hypothetical protein